MSEGGTHLCVAACLLALAPAWGAPVGAPGDAELDAAVSGGDCSGYSSGLSAWLGQKVPAEAGRLSEASLQGLLQDPAFSAALARRHFLSKVGVDAVGAFAKADPKNKAFLGWVLRNTEALELCLEGATPVGLREREANGWTIPVSALEIWARIYHADPDSRQGLHLKLAIATGLNPPGTGNRGAGQPAKPEDPLDRYQHFKAWHKNGELFSSFDTLAVWDYRQIVSSNTSDADLAWAREMLNTWMPQLRDGEKVVDTTSQVWRRNSPWPYTDSYKSVLEGGGKCGPRSSWSVMICQAFGIPAVGVGQPAHACVAYKAVDGTWQVAYGRGWAVSRLLGLTGTEFVEGVEARSRAAPFSRIERLRWLAGALTPKDRADAALAVAAAIQKSTAGAKVDLAKSEKPDESDADLPRATGGIGEKARAAASRPEPPIAVAPGVIHVEAEAFFEQGGEICYGGQYRGVPVVDCFTGGRQLYFQANMMSAWAGYKITAPAAGLYELTARVAAVNREQALYARTFGSMAPVKKATASNVFKKMEADLGPQFAVDSNPGTRWATDMIDKCWLELDLGKPVEISTVMIDERGWNRVSKYQVEYKSGEAWKTIVEGDNIGIDFTRDFPPVTAQYVRLNVIDTRQAGPSIWEFSVGSAKDKDGRAWINLPNTYGLWLTTAPVDIKLIQGEQTIWLFAPFQRGVALRWFELRPKGTKP
jgi:hypothetical protein